MINTNDILETINMIENENFDVRTITMGISLLDCIDDNIDKACDKVSFCAMDEGYREEGDWALNIRSVITFGRIRFFVEYAAR